VSQGERKQNTWPYIALGTPYLHESMRTINNPPPPGNPAWAFDLTPCPGSRALEIATLSGRNTGPCYVFKFEKSNARGIGRGELKVRIASDCIKVQGSAKHASCDRPQLKPRPQTSLKSFKTHQSTQKHKKLMNYTNIEI
jgi:hypothetical protein